MKRKKLWFIILLIISLIVISITTFFVTRTLAKGADTELTNTIDDFLSQRQEYLLNENKHTTSSPFGDDEIARILFIGLDSRAGQTHGHCDAIQLIEIDKGKNSVQITAVPRGTYSPLPPGVGATTTDYYVSNACGLVSLEYGVKQMEYILGKKADYIMVVGFSEVMGILKYLDLPTTPTLQWLRHRQGYAIGEPQRAHNHSTFLKKLLTTYIPDDVSAFNAPLHYIVYKLIQTDLSFEQTRQIIQTLSDMKLHEYPERVTLSMRPAYAVQDIAYDEEHVATDVQTMLTPIKHLLSPKDYSATTPEGIQNQLLEIINKQKNDPEFITWAFQNNIWLQLQDEIVSQQTQYDIMTTYLSTLTDRATRMQILSDYIIEMDYRGLTQWSEKGKELLKKELPS